MIYFTSDLHGEKDFRGFREYLDKATADDILIILGDIGLAFEKSDENREFTEFFLSAKKKIAFLDGNHENFGFLNSFPEEAWKGGTVRRLTENIVLLQRGNVYNIDGKTFFTFGGCKSSAKWKEMGLWYFGEEATEEELSLGYENLKAHGYSLDYILTHKYEATPGETGFFGDLEKLIQFIDKNVSFKKWYAGHYHLNERRDDKHVYVYDELIEIE